ncbi:MAG TPA: DHH family phosphoesterase [Nanoarchaeota archaeon]|nr:DHH family phosphoesterase [Candidatus Pacearchaeota archaeon]HIH34510.1 DHH family phosphoesterase [Nanoarchaeota archaeon]HIH51517.1 DHH family phosphoesterase [Nanoarchaeota archaeon]HIH66439.1 DHH family phosphoesterase [Nanoarchaeota archaeon]
MLSQKELLKIRTLLEASQNPLFFFDNDVDGLSSFLQLARFLGRGKGVVIKSYPGLDEKYVRKISELKCDSIFILDKPIVSPEFLDAAKQLALPIVWIDHHGLQDPEFVKDIHYFNPLKSSKPSSEPVSYWCYQVTRKKEDEWLALLGCIADYYVPAFAKEFAKGNPELLSYSEEPARLLFESKMGKVIKILEFSLKDKTSNVIKMMKFMQRVSSPHTILNQDGKDAEFIYSRFERINRKYEKLLERAKEAGREEGSARVLFFSYGGDLSISANLSNELLYNFPKKLIVVGYLNGVRVNISLRDGKLDLRKLLDDVMHDIPGNHGGHEHACGATVSASDLEKFRERVFDEVK